MSDVSQGPGWWLASDGKWYPPDQAPPPPPPPSPSAGRRVVSDEMSRPEAPGQPQSVSWWRRPAPWVVTGTALAIIAVIAVLVGLNGGGSNSATSSGVSGGNSGGTGDVGNSNPGPATVSSVEAALKGSNLGVCHASDAFNGYAGGTGMVDAQSTLELDLNGCNQAQGTTSVIYVGVYSSVDKAEATMAGVGVNPNVDDAWTVNDLGIEGWGLSAAQQTTFNGIMRSFGANEAS